MGFNHEVKFGKKEYLNPEKDFEREIMKFKDLKLKY
jgi:hypothetical protein